MSAVCNDVATKGTVNEDIQYRWNMVPSGPLKKTHGLIGTSSPLVACLMTSCLRPGMYCKHCVMNKLSGQFENTNAASDAVIALDLLMNPVGNPFASLDKFSAAQSSSSVTPPVTSGTEKGPSESAARSITDRGIEWVE